ncbi:hypothetical protein EVAR_51882_1 [Eumeta japonica]|uniref:Uncharacterized protein n=1 Tax=Eumeta variegata TaxID=151549 RepID=A0A4C1YIS9_EUMVA|nr:hypothetical protein EVAR_51882_1 [Eumeta japonica]
MMTRAVSGPRPVLHRREELVVQALRPGMINYGRMCLISRVFLLPYLVERCTPCFLNPDTCHFAFRKSVTGAVNGASLRPQALINVGGQYCGRRDLLESYAPNGP